MKIPFSFISKKFFTLTKSKSFVQEISEGSRNGANLKTLKLRMRSVKNIQKITKTMKMIASSRLKAAESRMMNGRVFGNSLPSGLLEIQTNPIEKGEKHLICAVTSDRGLCGGINTFTTKEVKFLFEELRKKDCEISIASFGEKGNAQLIRWKPENMTHIFFETIKSVNYPTISTLLDQVISEHKYDRVHIIFSEFVSTISYRTKTVVLPTGNLIDRQIENGLGSFDVYEFEEDSKDIHLRDYAEFCLSGLLWKAYLDNNAAELGARLSSMENASKNAGEVLKKLTLNYNKGRQAAITTELTEIISGAMATK